MVPSEILRLLGRIANEMAMIAIAWHLVLVAVVGALLAGWRPSRRVAAKMLAAPALSVAVVALAYGNPFNGILFAGLAAALFAIAVRLPAERAASAPLWETLAGILMIAYGWVYPHFLEGGSPDRYLYAAPTGLIPCPTLAVMIGFALVGDRLGSRAISLLLAAYGLFYALFGVIVLQVELDHGLLVGATACIAGLLTSGARSRRRSAARAGARARVRH